MKAHSLLAISTVFILCVSGCVRTVDMTQKETRSICKDDEMQIQTREYPAFDKVRIAVPADMRIISGDKFAVTLTSNENLLKEIDVNVSGNQLEISTGNKDLQYSSFSGTITLPESLSSVHVAKDTHVRIEGKLFDARKETIDISGMGSLQVDQPVTDRAALKVSGMRYVEIQGESNELDV